MSKELDGRMPDGHIAQDGINFRQRPANPGEAAAMIKYPVTGVVTAIYYLDDAENRDTETVLLDLKIPQLGTDVYKVPWLGGIKGSVDNYIHFAPRPARANVDKSPFNNLRINPAIADGDTVIVVFVDGNIHQPYAIAQLPHNQTEKISPSPRPKKADGEVFKLRMNGTDLLFDKDGNVTFNTTPTVDPSVNPKKYFRWTLNEKGKTQKVEFQLNNNGEGEAVLKVTGEDGKVHSVVFDHASQSVTIINDTDNGQNKIEMLPAGINILTPKLVNIVAGENTTIDVTGNSTTNISGNATVTVGGNSVLDVTGNADITTGGNTNITASGNVVVTGAQIQLNGTAGDVLTTTTDPVIDLITGAPTTGVPTVVAG